MDCNGLTAQTQCVTVIRLLSVVNASAEMLQSWHILLSSTFTDLNTSLILMLALIVATFLLF